MYIYNYKTLLFKDIETFLLGIKTTYHTIQKTI